MAAIVNRVTTLRRFFKMISIYPSDGSGHHAEVEMIGNGMWRSGLAFYVSDLLFDFFETGLDFSNIQKRGSSSI